MEKVKLYGGKIEIDFEPSRHIYKRNGEYLISVTAATGMIDKSRPLMFWAVKMCKEFLIANWDHKKKITELEKHQLLDEAAKQHTLFKKKAADIGTLVHDWAASYIKGENPDLPEDEKVLNGVTAFLKWVKETNVKFVSSEEIIYSKKYNYVGRMDLEAKIDGKYCIVDFKTSNGIYSEMLYQRAAYQQAKEEMTGRTYYDGYIVRFSKDDGKFEVKKIPAEDQKKDIKVFLAALIIKRREKELSKY